MQEMPQKCFYGAEQTRELDRLAIASGIPGYTLMQRAGKAAYRALRISYPRATHITLLCGSGNNGGDGYVVAGEALRDGLGVTLLSASGPSTDSARQAAAAWKQAGGDVIDFAPERLKDANVIVDALLGTGLCRPVEGVYKDAIAALNDQPAPVIALDIPSGLHADTGTIQGIAVQAALTVTFIARKPGLYTGAGRQVSGNILFDSLDVPVSVYESMSADACEASLLQCQSWLPKRKASAHKGSSGRLLVVGGDQSMSGAVGLAGLTAAVTGTGLVRVATRKENTDQVAGLHPELLVSGVADPDDLQSLLKQSDSLLLGPGLGQSRWSRTQFETCLEHGNVAVIDADGLNLLAEEPEKRADWVLTPHPGEAARLLDISVPDVMQDRITAANAINARYGGICVLKGSGTIIAAEGCTPYLCTRGNAALATAGTGDVLAGLVAGLIVQGMPPLSAAVAGVTLHACAGEMVAREGIAGVLASNLIEPLRRLRNSVCE